MREHLVLVACGCLVACGGEGASTPDANPSLLSGNGLYSDFAARTVAPEYREYTPAYELWADGAIKRRWLALPAGTQIDTSNMDVWRFPAGTKVWKEFSLDGKRLETRLIEKRGEGDFRFAVFVWRDDDSDADLTTSGPMDVRGTAHDVPTSSQCLQCHLGEPDRFLGLSAVQLSAPSTFLATLETAGLLSAPPPAGLPVPGTTTERQALGALHANCGHCHNPEGTAFSQVDMVLRIGAGEAGGAVSATDLYLTTVNQPTTRFRTDQVLYRIAGMSTGTSAVALRMHADAMGTMDQMPPIASEEENTTASGQIAAWIAILAPP